MPRPMTSYDSKQYGAEFKRSQMPLTWMSWDSSLGGAFSAFDGEAMVELMESKFTLCAVCGETMGETKIFGRLSNKGRGVSGSAMHPKCALIAFHYCPHFVKDMGTQSPFIKVTTTGCGFAVDYSAFVDCDEEELSDRIGECINDYVVKQGSIVSLADVKQLAREE